ncbi:hypothetical protein JXA88_09080 [Candidatus Fermentibacteria bacterium]|nr:hypothetical protein [Candidatus Fermentibacteria bacterium]
MQGRFQAEAVLESMARAGYHAAALGERELGLGRAFVDSIIEAMPFPLLAANLVDPVTGARLTKTYEIVDVGTVRVGILGLVMKTAPGNVDTAVFRIEDPMQWAQQLVPEIAAKSDVVVVLAHLGWGGAFSLAQQVPGIDVIVSGHGSYATEQPQRVGETVLVQAGDQGKRVGRLSITGEIKKGKFSGTLTTLGRDVPDDPDIKNLVSHYSIRVREYYSSLNHGARTSPAPTQVSQRYGGAQQCRACHAPVYERWLETGHSHAMATLEHRGKHFDPECVRCHSTGYGKPTGFISMKVNPDLANVQCEQCHGQGSLHIMYRTKGDASLEGLNPVMAERARKFPVVGPTVCLQCHTPDRDPDFTYREGDLTGIH